MKKRYITWDKHDKLVIYVPLSLASGGIGIDNTCRQHMEFKGFFNSIVGQLHRHIQEYASLFLSLSLENAIYSSVFYRLLQLCSALSRVSQFLSQVDVIRFVNKAFSAEAVWPGALQRLLRFSKNSSRVTQNAIAFVFAPFEQDLYINFGRAALFRLLRENDAGYKNAFAASIKRYLGVKYKSRVVVDASGFQYRQMQNTLALNSKGLRRFDTLYRALALKSPLIELYDHQIESGAWSPTITYHATEKPVFNCYIDAINRDIVAAKLPRQVSVLTPNDVRNIMMIEDNTQLRIKDYIKALLDYQASQDNPGYWLPPMTEVRESLGNCYDHHWPDILDRFSLSIQFLLAVMNLVLFEHGIVPKKFNVGQWFDNDSTLIHGFLQAIIQTGLLDDTCNSRLDAFIVTWVMNALKKEFERRSFNGADDEDADVLPPFQLTTGECIEAALRLVTLLPAPFVAEVLQRFYVFFHTVKQALHQDEFLLCAAVKDKLNMVHLWNSRICVPFAVLDLFRATDKPSERLIVKCLPSLPLGCVEVEDVSGVLQPVTESLENDDDSTMPSAECTQAISLACQKGLGGQERVPHSFWYTLGDRAVPSKVAAIKRAVHGSTLAPLLQHFHDVIRYRRDFFTRDTLFLRCILTIQRAIRYFIHHQRPYHRIVNIQRVARGSLVRSQYRQWRVFISLLKSDGLFLLQWRDLNSLNVSIVLSRLFALLLERKVTSQQLNKITFSQLSALQERQLWLDVKESRLEFIFLATPWLQAYCNRRPQDRLFLKAFSTRQKNRLKNKGVERLFLAGRLNLKQIMSLPQHSVDRLNEPAFLDEVMLSPSELRR